MYDTFLYFTVLSNGDQNVLGFDMVDMLGPADTIPERYLQFWFCNCMDQFSQISVS